MGLILRVIISILTKQEIVTICDKYFNWTAMSLFLEVSIFCSIQILNEISCDKNILKLGLIANNANASIFVNISGRIVWL